MHCEPAGSGQGVLKYLAPYIFRVAFSNNRLLKLQDGQVTFRYQDGETKKQKTAALPAQEFIRRFLQHVLPHRFQKVRYYGFFRAQQRPRLQPLQALLAGTPKAEDPTQFSPSQDTPAEPHLKVIRCPQCGRPMHLLAELPRQKPTSSPPPSIRSP